MQQDSPIISIFGIRVVVPSWYWHWMLFNDATTLHTLAVAGILQDLSLADFSIIDVLQHALFSIILSPISHLLQTVALLSALVVPSQGYCVIDKS